MIEVTGLYKRYGTHLAVNDVSFSVEKGEIVGFLGPNGAGKSTTMNIITGYLSLTRGKVVIDGFDILENPEEAKKRIGYLPEIPPVYVDMTVREYLNFVYDLKKVRFPKKAHINEIMRLVRIEEVSERLIKHLSKGYRQRVGFAQALVGNPDILILDEPTVGLDPKQIIEIRELIEKLGKNHTIILSSHILSEIQAVCKRIIVINNGKIVADDTPERLSEKLSEDLSLLATVVCDGENMKNALAEVDGVKEVAFEESEEDSAYDFVITPEGDADIRREIFRCIAENGGEMLSFTDNKMTLEQIFLKLTENAQPDEQELDGEEYGEAIEETEEEGEE
ncbi:MAG: ATP-binding cassette domain-containing protein [Clostridia bacterium]|nr:ATP-binding cassette domain-containing protein [Clostridia bacterium]